MKNLNPIYLNDPNNLQINKELIAIYNYITINDCKTIKNTDNIRNDEKNKFKMNDDSLTKDNDYLDVLNLIDRHDYFQLDCTYRILFKIELLPLIFKFLIDKNQSTLLEFSKKKTLYNDFILRLQNCIMFFSYVNLNNNHEINELFNHQNDDIIDIINNRSKKFRLRDSKFKNINLEDLYMSKIQKLIDIRNKIDKVKSMTEMKNFIFYIKKEGYTGDILEGENENINSENKMNSILYANIMLYNVIRICDTYLAHSQIIVKNKEDFNTFKLQFKDTRFFINVYKNIKNLYINLNQDVSGEKIIKDIVEFYNIIIEKKDNYLGSVELIRKYADYSSNVNNKEKINECQFFGSKLNEKKLCIIEKEYINNYYEHSSIKNERVYKIENMALEWSEDDYKKFFEGFKRYRTHQLSNNKIAKFMGSHIEVNHVRYFKNKILVEERKKTKEEKQIKIKEMRKKKNIHWKILK